MGNNLLGELRLDRGALPHLTVLDLEGSRLTQLPDLLPGTLQDLLVGSNQLSSLPASIADTIVIGVGDPARASLVSGHSSRQDAWTLKQVAAKFGGIYHDGNRMHLPSSVLDALTMLSPRDGMDLGLREVALIATALGATLVAGIGPLLAAFGMQREFREQRRRVRASMSEEAAT